MLHPRAEFQPEAPALVAEVRGDRRIAVHPLVGAANALFLRTTVIHHKGVKIQADITVVRRDRRPAAAEQAHAPVIGIVTDNRRMGLQLLPQPDAAGHPRQSQRLAEERILAEGFDGLKIALTQRQQGDVTLHET